MAEHSVITDPLDALTAAGVSIWLDDLSRERLTSGSLATLVRDRHVVGVTTNPTIFAAAITGSDAYTAQIRDLAARGAGSFGSLERRIRRDPLRLQPAAHLHPAVGVGANVAAVDSGYAFQSGEP